MEGPWVHGGWYGLQGNHLGRVNFASDTAEYYREHILFPFFEQYLKGEGDAKLPEARTFSKPGRTSGDNTLPGRRNRPKEKRSTSDSDGSLSFQPPASTSPAFDEYISDPAKPVPFLGYTALDVPQEYMVSDQRFASTRTDVLVYQTAPLDEDVTVAGPVSPRLFVSTSGTDSDWDVKLIDVYPPDYPAREIARQRQALH